MGRIITSLKIAGLFLMLISAAPSYWSASSSDLFIFPQQSNSISATWNNSPFGIFSFSFGGINEDPSVSAPTDIQENTDPGKCNANVTIPEITYTGNSLSWTMSGDTSGSGTGQIGTQTFERGTTTITFTAHGDNSTSAQETMKVTISDNEDPTITLGSTISDSTDAGECTASIAIPNAGISDNCTGEA